MKKYSIPKLQHKGHLLKVFTEYWEVEQDINRGGSIVSIVFVNGSGKNILRKPLLSYVDKMGDVLSFMSAGKRPEHSEEKLFFSTSSEKKPKVEIDKTSAGFPIIISSGFLYNNKGETTGISYSEQCEYHSSFIRRTITFQFDEPANDILVLGVAKIVIDRSLCEYAYKYSAWQARHGGNLLTNLIYGKVYPFAYPVYVERYPFRYLSLFNRGKDAIEFLPSSNVELWETGITGTPGSGFFGLYTLEDKRGNTILMEPFHELTLGYPDPKYKRPELKGKYSFTFTIGLPMIEKNYPADIRHVGFNNHPWPDEKEIRKWAEYGVNVARLHNDFDKSGNFWHDGTFPPYDEEDIKKMKETIATAHRYGIKVIPYFSLSELHPSSEAWKKNHDFWKRTEDDNDTEIHNYWQNGEYGAQMCLASGWNDYLKNYIKKIVETYGFDGVYFDWVSSLYCNNRRHKEYNHLTCDEILEFLEWTRNFLGTNRVLVIHTSASPFMAAESYADATIVFEEIYAPPAFMKDMPPIDCLQPQLDMANHIQKLVCPSILAFKGKTAAKKFVSSCIAMGLLSYIGRQKGSSDPFIENFQRLRKYKLTNYAVIPATRAPVVVNKKNIRVCFFVNNSEIIVIITNLSAKKELFNIQFNPSAVNPIWNKYKRYLIEDKDGKRKKTVGLNGIKGSGQISGYDYIIWRIIPILKRKT
ncbi:MAG TPA: DUF6259 domain-containing protein [bacterium]|nr:DUF6259 domain-containing protein [bacterium]